ncbi:hypothetical protein BBJ28_00014130, partial [Nothophytophthora sp. Chile5]
MLSGVSFFRKLPRGMASLSEKQRDGENATQRPASQQLQFGIVRCVPIISKTSTYQQGFTFIDNLHALFSVLGLQKWLDLRDVGAMRKKAARFSAACALLLLALSLLRVADAIVTPDDPAGAVRASASSVSPSEAAPPRDGSSAGGGDDALPSERSAPDGGGGDEAAAPAKESAAVEASATALAANDAPASPQRVIEIYEKEVRGALTPRVELLDEDLDVIDFPSGLFEVVDGDSGAGKRQNYASLDAGATILDSSPETKSPTNLLVPDKDRYMLIPCENPRKWVVISLSEDVHADAIAIANYEKFSSPVKAFIVLGSVNYPTDTWLVLGNFTAAHTNGEQVFHLDSLQHVRYIKFRFLSHYGSEEKERWLLGRFELTICRFGGCSVFGRTFTQVISQLEKSIDAEVGALSPLAALPGPPLAVLEELVVPRLADPTELATQCLMQKNNSVVAVFYDEAQRIRHYKHHGMCCLADYTPEQMEAEGARKDSATGSEQAVATATGEPTDLELADASSPSEPSVGAVTSANGNASAALAADGVNAAGLNATAASPGAAPASLTNQESLNEQLKEIRTMILDLKDHVGQELAANEQALLHYGRLLDEVRRDNIALWNEMLIVREVITTMKAGILCAIVLSTLIILFYLLRLLFRCVSKCKERADLREWFWRMESRTASGVFESGAKAPATDGGVGAGALRVNRRQQFGSSWDDSAIERKTLVSDVVGEGPQKFRRHRAKRAARAVAGQTSTSLKRPQNDRFPLQERAIWGFGRSTDASMSRRGSRSESNSSGSDVNFDDVDEQQVFGFLEDEDDARPGSASGRSAWTFPHGSARRRRLRRQSRPGKLYVVPALPRSASGGGSRGTTRLPGLLQVGRKSATSPKTRSPKRKVKRPSAPSLSSMTTASFASSSSGSTPPPGEQLNAATASSSVGVDGAAASGRPTRQREAAAVVPNRRPRAKSVATASGRGAASARANANAHVEALAALQVEVEETMHGKRQVEAELEGDRSRLQTLEQKLTASEQSSDLFARQLESAKESFQAKLLAREEELSREKGTLLREKAAELQHQQARFTTEAELWKHEIASLTKAQLELRSQNDQLRGELHDQRQQRDAAELRNQVLEVGQLRTREELQLLAQWKAQFEQSESDLQQLRVAVAEASQRHEVERHRLQEQVSRLLLEREDQLVGVGRERQRCVRQQDEEKAKLRRFAQEVRGLHRLLQLSVVEAREHLSREMSQTKATLERAQQQASELALQQSGREMALVSRRGRILQLETQLKNDRQTISQLEAALAKATRTRDRKEAALRAKFQEQKEHLEVTLAVRHGLATELQSKREQAAELERGAARLHAAKDKLGVRLRQAQQQIRAMQQLHACESAKAARSSADGGGRRQKPPPAVAAWGDDAVCCVADWGEFVALVAAYEAERQLQARLARDDAASATTAAAFCAGLAGGAALLAAAQRLARRRALQSTEPLDVRDASAIRHPAAALTELLVRYHDNLQRKDPTRGEAGSSSYAVRANVQPGALREQLPSECPEHPQSYADIFRDCEQLVFPALTHWASPNFHAYFKICGS